MRILIVSPDYASHYLPMSALGQALASRGHDVVVATGSALAERVRADGFEQRELILGPGSNPGLIRSAEQPGDEGDRLDGFLEATRSGMVATFRYQAESRLRDLLWEPERVFERLSEILGDVRPDLVVSDQLAFGATLALRALDQAYVSFHPGHPSAIPGPGEVFGFPELRPRQFTGSDAELAGLRALCDDVSAQFTRRFNATLRALNPHTDEVGSALSTTSDTLTLLNYPIELGGYRRASLPRTVRFVGASVRNGPVLDPYLAAVLERGDESVPRIYVSLGSFLSARSDVLERIVAALRDRPVQLIVATGVTPRSLVGDVPDGWHVMPYLPQVSVLRSCDLAICHGGNNTVTEALWAGVPLLVCPFATDQFAGAEDVRRAGFGDVFDPNGTPAWEIARRVDRVLLGAAPRRAATLGAKLRSEDGPGRAAHLLEHTVSRNRSSAA